MTLLEKLRRGDRVAGTMVFEFFSPGIAQICAEAGAEFVLFDMEHSGIGFDGIKQQMSYSRGLNTTPIVRVPGSEYDLIARALDCGATGIMVPMVESAAQAEAIVRSAKYPPAGRRGAAFGVAHDHYASGPVTSKIEAANSNVTMIAQIETADGASNVDAIAAVDGIDVLFLGHFDLTNSLGIPGQFKHPRYLKVVEDIVRAADRHGKVAGFMAADDAWAEEYLRKGFRIVAYGLDIGLYQSALANGLSRVRALPHVSKR